jgi:hypothetical protein
MSTKAIVGFDIDVIKDSIIRPDNTTAYAAGEVISEVTTNDHYQFSKTGGMFGEIYSAKMMINANKSTLPDLELWLFDADIAEVADNSAFAPTDAEILTLIDVIEFSNSLWKIGLSGADASGNIVQTVRNLNIAMPRTSNTIYGQLVVRNAYTPISSEQFDCHLIVGFY